MIRRPLHHFSTLRQMFGVVVGRTDRIAFTMSELPLNRITVPAFLVQYGRLHPSPPIIVTRSDSLHQPTRAPTTSWSSRHPSPEFHGYSFVRWEQPIGIFRISLKKLVALTKRRVFVTPLRTTVSQDSSRATEPFSQVGAVPRHNPRSKTKALRLGYTRGACDKSSS
jgi:hypothetical protein